MYCNYRIPVVVYVGKIETRLFLWGLLSRVYMGGG